MSIYSIKIKNYKTIKNSEIIFKGNLSGIYGPNGTGKTAILEVLEIIRDYYLSFFIDRENIIVNNLKSKILEGISKEKDSMEIEVVFFTINLLYKLIVEFKVENKYIYVLREELSFKEINSRKKFKNILKMINDENEIFPKLYFGNDLKENIELLDNFSISKKNILKEFNNFYSYLSVISNEFKENFSENNKFEFYREYFDDYELIMNTLRKMIIITLKEQAHYNLGILIPLNIHTDQAHGVIPINSKDGNNLYEKDIAEEIENVINQIGKIFSSIVPKSKLILTKEIVNVTNGNEKFAINIYVERNGTVIPLSSESTGIIKLVSLLSAMVYYVQDDEAIVTIDELDIHIFEYLLAILLEKLSNYAKGQLIFTAHNLLPMEKLSKDCTIISTKNDMDEIEYNYLKGVSRTTNIRQKYLKSQRMWSEDNIEPLLINTSSLDMFIKKLVI